MLVLARKPQQKIMIGDHIVVQVLRKSRDVVKLGIEAPLSVPVHRQEIYDEIQRSNQAALRRGSRKLPSLSKERGQPVPIPSETSAQSALAKEPPGPLATNIT